MAVPMSSMADSAAWAVAVRPDGAMRLVRVETVGGVEHLAEGQEERSCDEEDVADAGAGYGE